MTGDVQPDVDVVIIGGGPAGAALGTLLAREGVRTLIIERDVHPREHVGESLVPASNFVLKELGFLPKMEELGFVHKRGVGWTAPRSRPWKFVAITSSDFPLPGAPQPWSYNVERHLFDMSLLRHAHEAGAKVLQGVNVQRVLFEGDRAVGVRASAGDGWDRDLRARVVVDASGRRSLLGNHLRLKRKDTNLNQFCVWSWFTGMEPHPPGYEGHVFFHFLGLEKAWVWDIPMQNGVTSVGLVTSKEDFQTSGASHEEFFDSLAGRNLTLRQAVAGATRIRPWWVEGDYSYSMDRVAGPGWLMVGDAHRFVDPIFSSGLDAALHSAVFARDAILPVVRGAPDGPALDSYARAITAGVDIWYEITDLFYRLQALFTRFAFHPDWRRDMALVIQGNLYDQDQQARAQRLIDAMRADYDMILADPNNLLRPWAMDPTRSGAEATKSGARGSAVAVEPRAAP